ncbi:MAG: XRE family transcriptional regulator [Sphaerobacteraceae bacterium]|nr:MAG: XRE family transcriptional regulator [Sphaerobacteraceae bacterium]
MGELLRRWRQHRRVSQLDLALQAEVSARHISFLETGRSLPSREMLLRLADHLGIPLRERNSLLMAAGFAPVYPATSLEDPSMGVIRSAIDLVLKGHEPYPAIAIDRYWTLVTANRSIDLLLMGVAPELLEPPVNVLRLSLHPDGLAPRIINLDQWRTHVFRQLRNYIDTSADPALAALYEELRSYPGGDDTGRNEQRPGALVVDDLVIPLRFRSEAGELSFFSTTTVFGTANDVTLAELAIESFFPADAATTDILRNMAGT